MAYLSVDEQVEAITATAITGLGMSRAEVEAMIAKRDGDRLALNRLRVKLNARYRSVCAGINRTAEDKHADARASEAKLLHDATLEQAARDRRSERQRQNVGERINRALTELAAMSTVKSGWKEQDPDLKDIKIPRAFTGTEPGATRGGLVDGEVDVSPILNAITILTEHLEGVLDAQKGLVPPHELATLPTAIKDLWILNLRGVHSKVIAESMPWLGHYKTIERIRREAGQRPVDGTEPRERQGVAA